MGRLRYGAVKLEGDTQSDKQTDKQSNRPAYGNENGFKHVP